MRLILEFYNPFYFRKGHINRFEKSVNLMFGGFIQWERFTFSYPATNYFDGITRYPKGHVSGEYIFGITLRFMYWWLSVQLYRPIKA